VSRRPAKKDGVSGCIFEGRFKYQKLPDEAGILACIVYHPWKAKGSACARSPLFAYTGSIIWSVSENRLHPPLTPQAGRGKKVLGLALSSRIPPLVAAPLPAWPLGKPQAQLVLPVQVPDFLGVPELAVLQWSVPAEAPARLSAREEVRALPQEPVRVSARGLAPA